MFPVESEADDTTEAFDFCSLGVAQQLFLCDQLAKHHDFSHRLDFAEYEYHDCEETLPKLFTFQCPNMIVVDDNDDGETRWWQANYEISLTGSAESAAAISFCYYPSHMEIYKKYPCAWIEEIDLEILDIVDQEYRKYGLGDYFDQLYD